MGLRKLLPLVALHRKRSQQHILRCAGVCDCIAAQRALSSTPMRCSIALASSLACAATLTVLSTAAAMAAPRTVTPGSGPVLVTGASGLVGANVANALRQEGYTVRAAVRDPTAEKNEFLRAMGCELVRVPDLLSDEGWAEAMAGCVGLAHVASPVDIAGNTPEDVMISQAVEGTERALRFAAEAGTIKRVVVTATMASICGSQREKNPDHLWSELDKNDAPQTGYSKGKTAAEAKAWELAAQHSDKYDVTTVHPAVVLGPLLPGQKASSTMMLLKQILDGAVMPSMFGLCSTTDVAAVHVAGLKEASTAGERYLVCSRDQFSTLDIAELLKEHAPEQASAVDLAAWRADEKVAALKPKKPSTDNAKACALLGRDLEEAAVFVAAAAKALAA